MINKIINKIVDGDIMVGRGWSFVPAAKLWLVVGSCGC